MITITRYQVAGEIQLLIGYEPYVDAALVGSESDFADPLVMSSSTLLHLTMSDNHVQGQSIR